MKIFVVIPVHNRIHFTKGCLVSLSSQTYSDFEVVVVDDGSTDGTAEMIYNEFPDVHLLHGDGQLWWTGGINKGISYSLENGADYILTLNDDLLLPEDFIVNMVRHAREKPRSVFGALERENDSKRPIYAGHLPAKTFCGIYIRSNPLVKKLDSTQFEGIHKINLFHGRGLWVPRIVFETIGLFDQQRFPHYLADYDFTVSVVKHGFELYCNLDAPVYSFPEESGEKKLTAKKSLSNFYQHLFGRRGGGNLIDQTHFVLKHSSPGTIPFKLAIGYTRRILGYWLN